MTDRFSVGLVADHTLTGLGSYYTMKKPIGNASFALNIGFDFSYTTSTTPQQVIIERLEGPGRSISGGIGAYGGELAIPDDHSYQQMNATYGTGLDFESAKWQTSTNVQTWLR